MSSCRQLLLFMLLGVLALSFVAPLPNVLNGAAASQVSTAYHIIAYIAVTAFLVMRTPSHILTTLVAVIFFGTMLEFAQYFVPGRYFGVVDIVANSLGAVIGAGVAWGLLRSNAVAGPTSDAAVIVPAD